MDNKIPSSGTEGRHDGQVRGSQGQQQEISRRRVMESCMSVCDVGVYTRLIVDQEQLLDQVSGVGLISSEQVTCNMPTSHQHLHKG